MADFLEGAIASGNFATTGQFRAVKLSTSVDFEVILVAAVEDKPIGILQDNPGSSGTPALVQTAGQCKAEFGANGVTVGSALTIAADGRVVTLAEGTSGVSSGAFIIGHALQTGTSGGIYKITLVSPHISWNSTL